MSVCAHLAFVEGEARPTVDKSDEAPGRMDLLESTDEVWAVAADAAAQRYRLTGREREVLERLVRGRTRSEIARDLEVGLHTVKWHLGHLYRKLDVESSEQALRRVLFLEDPRWLANPLWNRDALERLARVADEVVRLGRSDSRSRLDSALSQLEQELVALRRRDGFDHVAAELGDDQRPVGLQLEKDHDR